jgi:hypothetical protein
MALTNIFNDEDSNLVKEHFAVIYALQRKRTRFPENCVRTVSTAAEAIAGADAAKHLYPGRVVGPSRSSEGFRLYYLVEWLGDVN